MEDLKAGKISIKEFGETSQRNEDDAVRELGRILGPERAKEFVRLSRGRLPPGYEPDPPR
jgi:hypothetical protein